MTNPLKGMEKQKKTRTDSRVGVEPVVMCCKWIKEKPTDEGWYWWRRGEAEKMIVKIVKVLFTNELNILFVGTETMAPLDLAHESCEWLKINEPADT